MSKKIETILWWSNAPWVGTGYGTQTYYVTQRLKQAGYNVIIGGYTGMVHSHVEWEGVTVLGGSPAHPLGMDVLAYYFDKVRPDLVVALCDAWAMPAQVFAALPVPVVFWTPVDAGAPVDARALGAGLRDFFDEAGDLARPLAMSKWGQQAFRRAGLDAGYIPHGIPTGLFAPPEDRAALRADAGISPDTFIVLINQANRSGLRKALSEQVVAFHRFWQRHPDSRLMLHMAKKHGKGIDLPLLCDTLGFPEGVVFFPDQGAYASGDIKIEDLPGIYGAADVTLQAVMAGGFELPALESQACGTPVIASDGSAVTEVAGPHSWLVPCQEFWVESTHQAFWHMPLIGNKCSNCGHVDGIEGALESAWQAREDGSIEQVRKASREHALQYDADLIAETMWKPYLAGIEAAL